MYRTTILGSSLSLLFYCSIFLVSTTNELYYNTVQFDLFYLYSLVNIHSYNGMTNLGLSQGSHARKGQHVGVLVKLEKNCALRVYLDPLPYGPMTTYGPAPTVD